MSELPPIYERSELNRYILTHTSVGNTSICDPLTAYTTSINTPVVKLTDSQKLAVQIAKVHYGSCNPFRDKLSSLLASNTPVPSVILLDDGNPPRQIQTKDLRENDNND